MKRLTFIALLLVCGLTSAETWTNHKGLTLVATSWQVVQVNPKLTTIKSKGNVLVTSVPDGVTISSEQLDFESIPNPKRPKTNLLSHASATTNVKIVKTVTAPSGTQTTEVLGPRADYLAGSIEGIVKIIGPTTIKNYDKAQAQSMTATGSSGIAYLDPGVRVASGSGLRHATLQGPVKVIFQQTATKTEAASTITATASTMQIQNVGNQEIITLIGSVHILGPGDSEASGVNRAVMVHEPGRGWRLDASGGK